MTSSTIHSGSLPESRKFSTISMRFRSLLSLLIPFSIILRRSSPASASRSSDSSSVRIASAPMPAVKPIACRSRASRYSSSVRSCMRFRSVSPESMTMYFS